MATNNQISGISQTVTDNDNQYSNFNLNQNFKYPKLSPLHSFSKSYNNKFYDDIKELKKWKNGSANSRNKSTLSLHISAYENSTEAAASNSFEHKKAKSLQKKDLNKKWKNVKQIGDSSTFNVQNPFEFSRQQKEDQKGKPEVMQFKASQILSNNNPKPKAENDSTIYETVKAPSRPYVYPKRIDDNNPIADRVFKDRQERVPEKTMKKDFGGKALKKHYYPKPHMPTDPEFVNQRDVRQQNTEEGDLPPVDPTPNGAPDSDNGQRELSSDDEPAFRERVLTPCRRTRSTNANSSVQKARSHSMQASRSSQNSTLHGNIINGNVNVSLVQRSRKSR
uniref:Uncharacterized protein n=1 Tax=Panagrolaimus davidi TaxID=227884 RepID=A0A914QA56_9BILA